MSCPVCAYAAYVAYAHATAGAACLRLRRPPRCSRDTIMNQMQAQSGCGRSRRARENVALFLGARERGGFANSRRRQKGKREVVVALGKAVEVAGDQRETVRRHGWKGCMRVAEARGAFEKEDRDSARIRRARKKCRKEVHSSVPVRHSPASTTPAPEEADG